VEKVVEPVKKEEPKPRVYTRIEVEEIL